MLEIIKRFTLIVYILYAQFLPGSNAMDNFEKKYGIKENQEVKDYHKSRRMFCIYNNALCIAEPNVSYSHATWAEQEGWMTREDDSLMGSMVRGVVTAEGDIYFYVGYNFIVNEQIESIFFRYVAKLVNELSLKSSAKIYGGLIKQSVPGQWPPRKYYGTVSECGI